VCDKRVLTDGQRREVFVCTYIQKKKGVLLLLLFHSIIWTFSSSRSRNNSVEKKSLGVDSFLFFGHHFATIGQATRAAEKIPKRIARKTLYWMYKCNKYIDVYYSRMKRRTVWRGLYNNTKRMAIKKWNGLTPSQFSKKKKLRVKETPCWSFAPVYPFALLDRLRSSHCITFF
jgi:hypothetical protein